MTLKQIQIKAAKNWDERAILIRELQLQISKSKKFAKQLEQVDKTIVRKLRTFPGDITTHRIANALEKLDNSQ